MAFKTHLYARLTRHYVTGWNHCDRWEPLTPARSTQPQLTHRDEDGGSTWRSLFTLTPGAWVCARWMHRRHAPKQAFTHWLAQQIAENLASGCRCEHDCCGHLQQYATARYLGKRRFSVELRRYRNI